MFLIRCPYCEESREETEFHAAGEAGIVRPKDPDACGDAEWGDYLYFRENPRGDYRELWVHAAGCGKYFELERNTATYEIHASRPVARYGAPGESGAPDTPAAEQSR